MPPCGSGAAQVLAYDDDEASAQRLAERLERLLEDVERPWDDPERSFESVADATYFALGRRPDLLGRALALAGTLGSPATQGRVRCAGADPRVCEPVYLTAGGAEMRGDPPVP